MMRFGMHLTCLLEWILDGFWHHLGGQVEAKSAPKSIKKESKMTSKKRVAIKKGEANFGEIVSVQGPPGRGI